MYTSGPSYDTVLILTNLQTSFNAIQYFFRSLQLVLNASKTDLEYVDIYKYLGVWLDCELSFQTHIKHLQSKTKRRIGFLFCNKASLTHAAKHILVKLTILPILDFGDVIYKVASNTLLNQLDVL